MILHRLKYCTRPNGDEPVREWLCELEKYNRAQYNKIATKIDKLEIEGFKLLATQMMKRLKGHDDLYELRGGQCRVLVYYDERSSEFVLLHGFLKKRRAETREIEEGSYFLQEYLSKG